MGLTDVAPRQDHDLFSNLKLREKLTSRPQLLEISWSEPTYSKLTIRMLHDSCA